MIDIFEKERKKAQKVIFFTGKLEESLKTLSSSISKEKQKSLEEYFWMIEEYKVSLFAQELKTVEPVSEKKLKLKLKELEEMV